MIGGGRSARRISGVASVSLPLNSGNQLRLYHHNSPRQSNRDRMQDSPSQTPSNSGNGVGRGSAGALGEGVDRLNQYQRQTHQRSVNNFRGLRFRDQQHTTGTSPAAPQTLPSKPPRPTTSATVPPSIRTPSGFVSPPSTSQPSSQRTVHHPPPMEVDSFKKVVEGSLTVCLAAAVEGYLAKNERRLAFPHTKPSAWRLSDSELRKLGGQVSSRLLGSLGEGETSISTEGSGAPISSSRTITTASTTVALTRVMLQTIQAASVGFQTIAPSPWEGALKYYQAAVDAINTVEKKVAMRGPHTVGGSGTPLLYHTDCPIRPIRTEPQLLDSASTDIITSEGAIPKYILQEVTKPQLITEVIAGILPMVAGESWSAALGLLATLKSFNADHLLPVDTALLLLESVVLKPTIAQRARRYQHLVSMCQLERDATATGNNSPPSAIRLVVPTNAQSPAVITEASRLNAAISEISSLGGASATEVPISFSKRAKLCWVLLRTVQHQERVLAQRNLPSWHPEKGSSSANQTLDVNVLTEPRTAAAATRILSSGGVVASFLSMEQMCSLVASAVNRSVVQQQTAMNRGSALIVNSSLSHLEEMIYSGTMAALLRCISNHAPSILAARKRGLGDVGGKNDAILEGERDTTHAFLTGPKLFGVITSEVVPLKHSAQVNKTDLDLRNPSSWSTVFYGGVLVENVLTILKKETALDQVVRGGAISSWTLGTLECTEILIDLLYSGLVKLSDECGADSTEAATQTFLNEVRKAVLIKKVVPGSRPSKDLLPEEELFVHYDTHLPLIRRLERIFAKKVSTTHTYRRGAWATALLLCRDRRQLFLSEARNAVGDGAIEKEMAARGRGVRGRYEIREDLRTVQTTALIHSLACIADNGAVGSRSGKKGDVNSEVVLQRLLADAQTHLSSYLENIMTPDLAAGISLGLTDEGGAFTALTPDEATLTFLFGPQWLPETARLKVLASARRKLVEGFSDRNNGGTTSAPATEEQQSVAAAAALREATLESLCLQSTRGFLPVQEILQGKQYSCGSDAALPLSDNFEDPCHPLGVHYNIVLASLQPSFILQATPVRAFCLHALPLPSSVTALAKEPMTRVHCEGELVWRLADYVLNATPSCTLVKCLQTLAVCSQSVEHTDGSAAPDSVTLLSVANLVRRQLTLQRGARMSALKRPLQLTTEVVTAAHKGTGHKTNGVLPPPWNCWRVALEVAGEVIGFAENAIATALSQRGTTNSPNSNNIQHTAEKTDSLLAILADTTRPLAERIERTRNNTHGSLGSAQATTDGQKGRSPLSQLLLATRALALDHLATPKR